MNSRLILAVACLTALFAMPALAVPIDVGKIPTNSVSYIMASASTFDNLNSNILDESIDLALGAGDYRWFGLPGEGGDPIPPVDPAPSPDPGPGGDEPQQFADVCLKGVLLRDIEIVN